MNRPIGRLFLIVIGLFALLLGFTSFWTVFDADGLEDNNANRRILLEQMRIKRGDILASDGTVLAEDVGRGIGSKRTYARRYPPPYNTVHPVGYSFVNRGQVELEKSHNDQLVGDTYTFSSLLDRFAGGPKEGNSVQLAIDPDVQQAAIGGLGSSAGAVVALEPSTGAVLAMASTPGYNPNDVPQTAAFRSLSKQSSAPLLDRATQSGGPPGSTFKVVVATAAIDSGKVTPSTQFNGPSPLMVDGSPLHNDGNQSYGSITVTEALTNSVNTVFAQIGQRVGAATLFEYMDRFGFNSTPPIDLPQDEVMISGVYQGNNRLGPGATIDIGRMSIGQERLQVTALQMAMVVSAIANGGVLMKPHLWQKELDPDGRTVDEAKPAVQARVMKASTSTAVTQMMESVVERGTGTVAQIPGVKVAGKTGTAETVGSAINQAWFVSFAPANDPQVAVAATVQGTTQFGAQAGGPIAKQVMEAALGKGEG